MVKPLNEKNSHSPPGAPERIEVEAERLDQESLTLQDLRKRKALTQTQLAETLGIRQATVAQMEKRSDLLISTLRNYVEAMGGRLDLVVAFPNRVPVHLDGLGEAHVLKLPRPLEGGPAGRS